MATASLLRPTCRAHALLASSHHGQTGGAPGSGVPSVTVGTVEHPGTLTEEGWKHTQFLHTQSFTFLKSQEDMGERNAVRGLCSSGLWGAGDRNSKTSWLK